ncbi:hypothetical protein HUO09_17535 [Vibrio sp. Y2-5]|uniref:hypothetical protein n=1 Tax=Vibrio sp. Y2-5 TaxID=2743977 RepID=UPI001660F600|nr:hypothetical protein [Vibrio sp. Y2-5]MBD0788160.1 hypothetical protein [Vibrio sp. Y2-5]
MTKRKNYGEYVSASAAGSVSRCEMLYMHNVRGNKAKSERGQYVINRGNHWHEQLSENMVRHNVPWFVRLVRWLFRWIK